MHQAKILRTDQLLENVSCLYDSFFIQFTKESQAVFNKK